MVKRPPYHLTTVHLSSLTFFHSSTHPNMKLPPDYVPLPHACSIFTLSYWNGLSPFLVHRYPTYPYQPFKACPNASCSMKLALNPHLALVLSVVPTGLCLHFHYRNEPSGLQILTCCLPSPQDYQLLEDRDSVTHLRVPNA